MSSELVQWIETAEVEGADVRVPPNLIRALLAQSVVDNWPRYEVEHDAEGNPVVLRFGTPSAANKALELLAKDAGMMAEQVAISAAIEIKINGVDVSALH